MNTRDRIGLFGVPAAVVVIVIMLVVPLPSFMLDLLISLNLAAALVILLTTMHVEKARDFSVFPSLLLVATMFRLALNVSVTRLVLLHGYAGAVVQSFGNFVIGGQIVVGMVVFLILILIQFVVVTSGAGRVAEVAARFSLDAMAPKLVAIDGELNSGLIDEKEARRRRREIDENSEFYGNMDGASKFVRGDAIAALVITMVNLFGGFIIGIMQRHLSLSEAVHTYSVLSIGDGLVSQIPALLLSISTGLIVTRAKSDDSDFGGDIFSQIHAQHRALQIAGAAMGILALVPGLPHIPFLAIGVALWVMAAKLRHSAEARTAAEEASAAEEVETEGPDTPAALAAQMRVERLELELAANLTPLADQSRGGDLPDRVRGLRRKIALERGLVVPTVRMHDNVALPADTYAVRVNGVEVARGRVYPGKLLAIGPAIDKLPGEKVIEPAFRLPAKWIPAELREQAVGLGIAPIDPSSAMITHLAEVIYSHGADLLSSQQVNVLLDAMKGTDPAVIEEMKLAQVSVMDLHRVLVSLIDESVPITDVVRIVEAVTARARLGTKSNESLVEAARGAIGSRISADRARDGRLGVITFDAVFEQGLLNGLRTTDSGSLLNLEPAAAEHLIGEVRQLFDEGARQGRDPVLVVAAPLRPSIARLLSPAIPRLSVLSVSEIGKQVQLDRIGVAHASTAVGV